MYTLTAIQKAYAQELIKAQQYYYLIVYKGELYVSPHRPYASCDRYTGVGKEANDLEKALVRLAHPRRRILAHV